MKRIGILLVNLGTPVAPNSRAVKRFLSEFLHDKRVVDLSRWLWCPLLHGIILPIRSPKVAKLYQAIWMEDGSPLLVYSQRLKEKLQVLSGVPVELGMTYGEPGIRSGLQRLMSSHIDDIVILPLYPQYSATTTGAVFDAVAKALMGERVIPNIHFIRDYHEHPLYIQALASQITAYWALHGRGDYLLCSYHGIPRRFADAGDIYPAHCEQTTMKLQQALGISSEQIGMSYQSRFGREEWLTPYTDDRFKALPSNGIKKLDVVSPAFSVDCLETLEEISQQGKSTFMQAGGEQFHYIPCLNDEDSHVEMMLGLIEAHSHLSHVCK